MRKYLFAFVFIVCASILMFDNFYVNANEVSPREDSIVLNEEQESKQTEQPTLPSTWPMRVGLTTPTFEDISVDDEVEVKYTVTPENIIPELSGHFDEIVFAIDVSKEMTNVWRNIREFFMKDFENSLGTTDIRVGFVPYIDQVEAVAGFDSMLDLTIPTNLDLIENNFKNNIIKPTNDKTHQPGFGAAGNSPNEKILELLEPGMNNPDTTQAVVFISSGDINLYYEKALDDFITAQLPVITLNVAKPEASKAINISANEFHKKLGGLPSDYYEVKQGEDYNNSINVFLKSIVKKVSTAQTNDGSTEMYNNQGYPNLEDKDEVIIVLDHSKYMYEYGVGESNTSYISGGGWFDINDFFTKDLKYTTAITQPNFKLALLPFATNNTSGSLYGKFLDLEDKGEEGNLSNLITTFKSNKLNPTIENTGERYVDNSIILAKELFQKKPNKDKAIIFITSGEYTIYTESSINLDGVISDVITIQVADPTQDAKNSAEKIHNKLNGAEENFIKTQPTRTANPDLNLPTTREVLREIFGYDSSLDDTPKPVDPPNPNDEVTLTFELGPHLEQVEGLVDNKDGTYSYTKTINYNLVNGVYEAAPFNVEFKVKYSEVADSEFTFTTATVNYPYLGNEELDIAKPNFIPNTNNFHVKLSVTDSVTKVPEIYDSNENELVYTVRNGNNETGANYKLYGKSNVSINFSGEDITHLRYQFVPDGADINPDKWSYVEGANDVVENNPGHLTQMPYDVSGMPTLSGREVWSNRDNVFETPFANRTGPISLKVSPAHEHENCDSDEEHYVTLEQVQNGNNELVNRWVPKTLFVAGHRVSDYAPDYKEASKTWGYLKVPTSGDYKFKTWTDDGFYGTIMVDDEIHVIGDAFYPKGGNKATESGSIPLEAGKYYPIYLEYFNWGGSARFEMSVESPGSDKFTPVDKQWFYPSNSDSPTDGGNNIFMGSHTVSFEAQPGVYKLIYEVGEKDGDYFESSGAGEYGVFEVEERFELEKTLDNSDSLELNSLTNLIYHLIPKPILPTDLYKVTQSELRNHEQYKQDIRENKTYTVTETLITDELPKHFVTIIDEKVTNKISKSVGNIVYKFVNAEYIAEPIDIKVPIKPISLEAEPFEENSGKLEYRDVTYKTGLEISMEQIFVEAPTFEVFPASEITTHGMFNLHQIQEKPYEDDREYNVVPTMYYQLGFILDAQGNNNDFTIEFPSTVTVDFNNLYLYELDENGIIIEDSEVELINTDDLETIRDDDEESDEIEEIGIIITDDTIKFIDYPNFIERGKKYIVLYSLKNVEETSTINVSLDNDSSKMLNLNVLIDDLEELPDLL